MLVHINALHDDQLPPLPQSNTFESLRDTWYSDKYCDPLSLYSIHYLSRTIRYLYTREFRAQSTSTCLIVIFLFHKLALDTVGCLRSRD